MFYPDGNHISREVFQLSVFQQFLLVQHDAEAGTGATFRNLDSGRKDVHKPFRSLLVFLALTLVESFYERIVDNYGETEADSLHRIVVHQIQCNGFLQFRLPAGSIGLHILPVDGTHLHLLTYGQVGAGETDHQEVVAVID